MMTTASPSVPLLPHALHSPTAPRTANRAAAVIVVVSPALPRGTPAFTAPRPPRHLSQDRPEGDEHRPRGVHRVDHTGV